MLICFVMKKVHFLENLLLRPKVPLKNSVLTLDHINFLFVEGKSSETWLVKSLRNSREGNRDLEMPFPFFKIRFCRISS